MHTFYTPDIRTKAELPEEEAAHCLRVLRLTVGDEVLLTDGKGFFYKALIDGIAGKRCRVKVIETIAQEPLWTGHLHLAMAPTKNIDRTEWFVEKATEIGFDELTFLNCRFSERKVVKNERIEKIVISAVKQSLKARKPLVNGMVDFAKFVCKDFPGVLNPEAGAVVLVGPEGDFSPEEVKLAESFGFQPVSLGKSRLRTETAALVSVHLMNLAHVNE